MTIWTKDISTLAYEFIKENDILNPNVFKMRSVTEHKILGAFL